MWRAYESDLYNGGLFLSQNRNQNPKTKYDKDINIRESKTKNTLINPHKNQGNHEVLLQLAKSCPCSQARLH